MGVDRATITHTRIMRVCRSISCTEYHTTNSSTNTIVSITPAVLLYYYCCTRCHRYCCRAYRSVGPASITQACFQRFRRLYKRYKQDETDHSLTASGRGHIKMLRSTPDAAPAHVKAFGEAVESLANRSVTVAGPSHAEVAAPSGSKHRNHRHPGRRFFATGH